MPYEFIYVDIVTIMQPLPHSNSEKIAKRRTGNELEYNKL